MGTAAPALIAVAVAATTALAHAESRCTGVTNSPIPRFVTCFDLGNRLSITAGSDGFGGGIALRHVVTFEDEPDLIWKLDHQITETTHAAFEDRFEGVIYRGRFTRHARDGHLVIPLGTPKKVFLPFDIGAIAEAGTVRWRPGSSVELGMIKVGPVIDLSRTRSFRRRLAFGPIARWDVALARNPDGDWMPRLAVDEHVVAPFSTGMLELAAESLEGRTAAAIRVEAGTAWSSLRGWKPEVRADVSLERILLAVNDHPVSLLLGARYERRPDIDGELTARIGARVVLFDRRDARVNLSPLTARR